MTDDRNLSNDLGEDPELDALFATAGRFPVKTGFEDRVLRVVALPLPDWAIKIRNLKNAVLHSRLGRVGLAGLGLAMVTAITLTANSVWSNRHLVREWLGTWIDPSFSFRALLGSLVDSVAGFLPAGIANRSFAFVAAGVVGISAVGLYITAGPPALRSRHAR